MAAPRGGRGGGGARSRRSADARHRDDTRSPIRRQLDTWTGELAARGIDAESLPPHRRQVFAALTAWDAAATRFLEDFARAASQFRWRPTRPGAWGPDQRRALRGRRRGDPRSYSPLTAVTFVRTGQYIPLGPRHEDAAAALLGLPVEVARTIRYAASGGQGVGPGWGVSAWMRRRLLPRRPGAGAETTR